MPSIQTLRIVEHLHGHLGWLTAAALIHPAIVLRRNRGGRWAVGLSTGFVTLTVVVGVWLYTPYRTHLRQHLFQASATMGLLFERKEHLAFGAFALAWVGALAYVRPEARARASGLRPRGRARGRRGHPRHDRGLVPLVLAEGGVERALQVDQVDEVLDVVHLVGADAYDGGRGRSCRTSSS